MYQIANYATNYMPTNSKGGDLINATYVKMPVNPRGKGLRALLKHKDGLEIFAIWALVLEAATETTKPELRGKLLNHKDEPATIEEIAESISLDNQTKKVQQALSVLVSMGWMEYVQGTESVRTECVPSTPIDKISKDKIRQSNTDCAFESFWMKYPKKVGKGAALSAFNKIKPNQELLAKMLIAIDQQKSSTQWKAENGRYIPNPATWLNQGRWDDVVETPMLRKPEHPRCRLCNRILNSGERQDGVCLQCKFKEKQTA